MNIKFGKKFTQIHLDEFIEKYWEKAKNSALKEEIIFDLSEIEWIALEEITFLFAWFRYLLGMNKKIYIKLPSLDDKATKKTQRLINLWNRWEIWKFVPYDPLINGYRYENFFNISTSINTIRDRFNRSELFNFEQFDDNNIRILPFIEINVPEKNDQNINIDNMFNQEIYSNFNFDTRIEKLLNYYTSNSIFENKAISHIITSELYYNTIHHAFSEKFESKKQCYSAINLKGKFDVEIELQKENKRRALIYANDFGISFELALKYILINDPCSVEEAEKKVDWLIKNVLPVGYTSEREVETLPFFEEKDFKKKQNFKYRNESFIEYTFLDFGIGIANTLSEQYKSDISNPDKFYIKEELNKDIFNQNLDTQILEYAFLLSSSRHPFDVSLENNNLIPRGLYFLLDIVRRYRGMVIARSGKGKIIYDFSTEIIEIKNALRYSNNDNNLPNFQGTLISITIPAKIKVEIKQGAAKPAYKIPNNIQNKIPVYVNIRELYKICEETPKPYTKLFIQINKILDQNYKNNKLIIFDFLAFNISNIDHKILYFLSTSPKVNEVTSVIITNFKNEVLIKYTQKFIQEKITFAGSFNLFVKPIPIINSINEVYWIGVANQEDEKKLNDLLNYKDYQVSLSDFENKESNLGNLLFADKFGNVTSVIPTIEIIYEFVLFRGNNFREIFLNDKDSNKKANLNQIYLTAGGYFQEEYISLFEKLNDRTITKPLAEVFLHILKYKFGNLKYNKIVSVTLSSQLIAKAIDESLREQEYLFGKSIIDRPFIIRLASYYSFDDEIEFKNINQGDKVLVVNDVISTGNLIKRINDSIKRLNKDPEKEPAEIVGVLTVVDTRKNLIEEKEKEILSIDFNQISGLLENKIIKLFDYPINKYKNNPKNNLSNIEIIRINPILNTEISLDSKTSEEYKIAFKTQDMLKEIPAEFLYIGHFSNNYVHHSYFFNTTKFFQSSEGAKAGPQLLRKVYDTVKYKEKESIPELNLISIRSKIKTLREYNTIFSKKNNDDFILIDKILKKTLTEIWSTSKYKDINKISQDSFDDTFIFYPFFSGIEEIQKKELSNIFGISQDRILDLQRFDTIKGWRFIPVPKKIDDIIIDKSIIVLDDGSCTGDTIIQIIDSLCFVRVKKITVISIIGRLEDFNREFLSRIKELKVKSKTFYKKDNNGNTIYIEGNKVIDEFATQNEKLNGPSSMIPVNIYFGSNFHIPIYPSPKECPICKEIEILKNYKSEKNIAMPNEVDSYINNRINEIQNINTSQLQTTCPSYFPTIKINNINSFTYDTSTFYQVRDELGKIDGYRFFKNYYNFFNEIKHNDKQNLEVLMALCIHEYRLLDTIKNQLPDIYIMLRNYVQTYLQNNSLEDMFYCWSRYSFFRFYININQEFLFTDDIVKIIKFIIGDNYSTEYLIFFIWEKHYLYRSNLTLDFDIYLFRENIFKQFITNEVNESNYIQEKIINICDDYSYNAFNEIDLSFYKLKQIFKEDKLYNRNYLNQENPTSHPSLFNAVYECLSPITRIIRTNSISIEDIQELNESWKLKKDLLSNLILKPLNIISPYIKGADLSKELTFLYNVDDPKNISTLINQISELLKDDKKITIETIDRIKEHIKELLNYHLKVGSLLSEFSIQFLEFNPIENINYICCKNSIASDILTNNQKIKFELCDKSEFKGYFIKIHPLFLKAILIEILNNYNKHAKGEDATISIFKDDSHLIIKYFQNKYKLIDSPIIDESYIMKISMTAIKKGMLSFFGIEYLPSLAADKSSFTIRIPLIKSFKI